MKITKLIFPLAIAMLIALANCQHEPFEIPDPHDLTDSVIVVPENPADSICFDEQIAPILHSNCARSGCHDDTTRQSGINLSSYQTTFATISGNLLMQAIQDQGPLRMPPNPDDSLTAAQIALIQQWINQGMQQGVDCQGPCDTSNVTFSGTINPILQNNCVGCHSNSTGTNLVGYPSVYAQVLNGKFACSVNHTSCALPMPQNAPQLSACKLRQINIWLAAGAPNN